MKRRRAQRRRLVQIDVVAETEASRLDPLFSATDAWLDAEKILAEAPPKVRAALMMRYGGSEEWAEVAAKTGTSVEAIRKSCGRCLDRLRRQLGILA